MGKKYTNRYLDVFEEILQKESTNLAKNTLKNYRADIGQFIKWYEIGMKKKFHPKDVTSGNIEYYILYSKLSRLVLQRHLSALRKFFAILDAQGLLSPDLTAYFYRLKTRTTTPSLSQFALYLRVENASEQTIKHYKIDVKHFLKWLGASLGIDSLAASKDTLFSCIDQKTIQSYIEELLKKENISKATVYRRKAAMNRFVLWLQITAEK